MHPAIPFAAPLLGLAVVGAAVFAIPQPPDPTSAENAELGIIYWKLKDGRAPLYFERAIVQDPTNVRAHYGAGVAALTAKRYVDAERDFQAVLKSDPKHVDALYGMAAVYHETGRTQLVEPTLKQMLVIEPKDSRAYEDLANIALRRQDWAAAHANFSQYLKLMPKSVRKKRKRIEAQIAKLEGLIGKTASPPPSPVPSKKP